MPTIPALCCPQPAFNAQHPHEVPVTPVDSCIDAKPVFICGEAPTPVNLEGTACDGSSNPAAGNKGEIVQVVQAPGQVMTVRICEDDRDFELSCGVDPVTGHQVQTAYKIVAGAFELIKRWDTVTGVEWTGDPATLEGCGGKTLESEQELFCDTGVPFLRWYVIEEGRPTGDVVDTDLNGQPYTVTNPATVVKGECKPTCADEPIRDCNGSVIGYGYTAATALVVGATATMDDCDGNTAVYLMAASDTDHPVPIEGCDGSIAGYAASKGCETSTVKDIELVFMCDAGTTFIRHFVYLDGAIDSTYDTNTLGSPYTVSSEASVTVGACVAQCAPATYQGVQTSW